MRWWCFALGTSLGLGLCVETAYASEEPEYSRLDMGFGVNLFRPVLGRSTFNGAGTPLGGGPRESFAHTGRQVGVMSPVFIGAELRADLLKKYFDVGGRFLFGASGGNKSGPTDPDAAALTDVSSITSVAGALHVAGAIPLGNARLSFGSDLGVQSFSLPLTGYQRTTCSSKYGSHPCPETATLTQPWLRPQVSITWAGTSTSLGARPFVTVWVGADIFPSPSPAGGLAFGCALGGQPRQARSTPDVEEPEPPRYKPEPKPWD